MILKTISLLLTATYALPSTPSSGEARNELRHLLNDPPDSPSVIEALSNPDLYARLSNPTQQTPFEPPAPFPSAASSSCGAQPVCPAYDGETRTLNGRKYRIYCHNAPWGTYFWLPAAKSLEECEAQCDKNSYDCNGLTYYPLTGACTLIYSKDAAPYIWDNGYPKIGAIPVDAGNQRAFGPGMMCPLPGSDNQVWDFGKHQFKMSCTNQFKVAASAKKNVGPVKDVDECGGKCGNDSNCYAFHYYQPYFPGGRVDGMRNCELITEEIESGKWTATAKPNQYLSGLKVGSFKCGDKGWGDDYKGNSGKCIDEL
ncbi:hypothetical protein AOQ84DRAFT_354884 [Glonium stellatum]|uniref:Apple domain-containing protein n=1 Tax=Glonium stellatum TaxID=574774 RepID=A0A8E2EZV8_9PEZI|nr:hypothetical protein AOQ84DRAFT_354884 [Glonium stellatum]